MPDQVIHSSRIVFLGFPGAVGAVPGLHGVAASGVVLELLVGRESHITRAQHAEILVIWRSGRVPFDMLFQGLLTPWRMFEFGSLCLFTKTSSRYPGFPGL